MIVLKIILITILIIYALSVIINLQLTYRVIKELANMASEQRGISYEIRLGKIIFNSLFHPIKNLRFVLKAIGKE